MVISMEVCIHIYIIDVCVTLGAYFPIPSLNFTLFQSFVSSAVLLKLFLFSTSLALTRFQHVQPCIPWYGISLCRTYQGSL